MDKIQKTFETRQDDGWWIASTRDVDRQMDIVEPRGLVLDNYQRNNLLLWAHDYSSPHAVIGRAVELSVTDQEVKIRPEWREPASDSDPMHIIRGLIDSGLVRALSIGFRPLEAIDNAYGGKTYSRAELLEISLVPVPAQQNAVREQLAYAVKSLGDLTGEQKTETMNDTVLPAATDAAEQTAQGQTPETTAATVVADADAESQPDSESAAFAQHLAELLASVLEYLREDQDE